MFTQVLLSTIFIVLCYNPLPGIRRKLIWSYFPVPDLEFHPNQYGNFTLNPLYCYPVFFYWCKFCKFHAGMTLGKLRERAMRNVSTHFPISCAYFPISLSSNFTRFPVGLPAANSVGKPAAVSIWSFPSSAVRYWSTTPFHSRNPLEFPRGIQSLLSVELGWSYIEYDIVC